MAKYNVYFEFEPVFIEDIEANSPEEAEEIAKQHITYDVQLCEVTDSE